MGLDCINRHRRHRRDRLSARYLRLRDHVQLRVVDCAREPELEFPRQGEGWGEPELGRRGVWAEGGALWERVRWEYDEHLGHRVPHSPDEPELDYTWIALRRALEQATVFNPALPAPPARRAAPERRPRARPEALERRLVAHLAASRRSMEHALLSGELLYDRVLSGAPEHTRAELAALWSALSDELNLAIALLCFRPFWIRSPQTWRADAGRTIVEHLLQRFEVAPALRDAWRAHDPRGFDFEALTWWIAMAQGCSLRRLARVAVAQGLAGWVPLPKKFPQLFARAPRRLSFTRAKIYTEVLRLGGGEEEFRWLVADPSFRRDPLRASDSERSFFAGAVGWLSRHRDALDNRRAREVLAWARHRQTEAERSGGRGHEWSARTLGATLREAAAYAEQLMLWRPRYGYARVWSTLSWRTRGWDWEVEVQGKRWSIRELSSSAELRQEGQLMRHCVGGYDHRCYGGQSAIFSVRVDDRRALTVELHPGERRLVQVHGKCNRLPSASEQALVERWRAEVVRACAPAP